MSEIYRQGKLGDCLVDALDVLIKAEKISPDLAYKVLAEFDAAMISTLDHHVSTRASFRGHLDTYRFCDNVWTFVLSNASFRTSQTSYYTPEVSVDKVKIVCVDTNIVERRQPVQADPQ